MKDLYGWLGYLGTCEPDPQGGLRGRLIGLDPPVTYAGATFEDLKEAHRQAIFDYLDACSATGREPAIPPEPFGEVGSRDVELQFDLRHDPIVRILGYYSLREIFLRSRDANGTARTMSAWCMIGGCRGGVGPGECFEVAENIARALDRYGWHPCPSWTGASWTRSRP